MTGPKATVGPKKRNGATLGEPELEGTTVGLAHARSPHTRQLLRGSRGGWGLCLEQENHPSGHTGALS